MNKTLTAMIGALMVGLTACSTGDSSFSTGFVEIRPNRTVAGNVTITETLDKETGKISTKTETTSVKWIFSAGPGSPGGRILGFRITSEKVGSNPDLIDPKKPFNVGGINVYVQSGWSCTPAPGPSQSCLGVNKDKANGAPSGAVEFAPSGALESFMLANRGSASVTYNFTFYGVDDAGKPFEIALPGEVFTGTYNRAG
jgi:hypothetical protein